MWLSLVERCVRDAEVEGSNPFIPTIFLKKPIVSLAVGFLLGFAEFLIHPFGSSGVPLPEG